MSNHTSPTLFDHASVHEGLDPIAGGLRWRSLVNLTTSTPNQARELAARSASRGIDYLDGGVRRQIAAGHGKEGFARIFEDLRSAR